MAQLALAARDSAEAQSEAQPDRVKQPRAEAELGVGAQQGHDKGDGSFLRVVSGAGRPGGPSRLVGRRKEGRPAERTTVEQARVDEAVVAERNRIAREIHDTLAQGLAAIRLQLELARGEPGLPPGAAKAVELAYQIAGENLVETRRSMSVLKSRQPSLLTSLTAAIDGVRRLGQGKVVAELRAAPSPPNEIAHELLRIAQEAMLNASRHADARTIRVALTPIPKGGVRIAVADDGRGFDPATATPGFGLVGLRERAAAIKAQLSIASKLGGGTKVAVSWAP